MTFYQTDILKSEFFAKVTFIWKSTVYSRKILKKSKLSVLQCFYA